MSTGEKILTIFWLGCNYPVTIFLLFCAVKEKLSLLILRKEENMKRLFVVLLAVGLIAALSMPVLAANFKASGFYEVAGYWESNRAMRSSDEIAQKYYTSRFQINPVFNVAEGLKLVTRFEGLERMVGRDAIGADITGSNSRNTKAEQDLTMRRAYISAKVLSGTFEAGYLGAGRTGTVFMNYDTDVFRIKYTYQSGPWSVQLITEKVMENSLATPNTSESDKDKYAITPVYKWSTGEVGTQLQWYSYNDKEQAASNPYRANYYLLCPWFKATIGPVYVEGEVNYYWGKAYDYLNPATQDKDYDSLNYYLMARYTAGPVYLGAQIATVAGNDPNKADKVGAASAPSGTIDYQPTLVLWNDWTQRFTGQAMGTNGTIASPYYVSNANLYQVYGGFKPMAKLDLSVSFAVAKADQKPSGYVSDDYGKEFDIKASYKIFDNLEYMAAFGYLWTGDYFKGTSSTNTIGNDWLLMHKLTLNF